MDLKSALVDLLEIKVRRMGNAYTYKRLNDEVKRVKQEMIEDLIDLLTENDVKKGEIIIDENTIMIKIKSTNVKTTLFRHVDKYMGSAGRISIKENDLFLTYEL